MMSTCVLTVLRESVSNIESILTKGVFHQIQKDTDAMRSKNKELDFTDSIYDGRTVADEDKEFAFDDEVVNSKIYRDALKRLRKESGGPRTSKASFVGGNIEVSSVFSKIPASTIDEDEFSTSPIEEESAEAHDHWKHQATGYSRVPAAPRDAGTYDQNFNLKEIGEQLPYHPPYPASSSSSYPEVRQMQAPNQTPLVREPSTENTVRKDSAFAARLTEVPSLQYSDYADNYSPDASDKMVSHQEFYQEKEILLTQDLGEKIPAQEEEVDRGRWSDLSSAVTHSSRGSIPRTPPILNTDTDATSPDLMSPLTRRESYFGFNSHGLGIAPVPQTDETHERELVDNMQRSLSSGSESTALKWAEEVLCHLKLTADYETRLSGTQKPRTTTPESEQQLRVVATQLVDAYSQIGNGYALFIKARWIEQRPDKRRDLLAKAVKKNCYRACYYLGLIEEDAKNIREALHQYKIGEAGYDAACQFVSSSAPSCTL